MAQATDVSEHDLATMIPKLQRARQAAMGLLLDVKLLGNLFGPLIPSLEGETRFLRISGFVAISSLSDPVLAFFRGSTENLHLNDPRAPRNAGGRGENPQRARDRRHLYNCARMKLRVLTIVGVGLLGGSIGLAAKRRGIADCVRGLGRSRKSLDEAKALGAIDEVHLDPTTAIPGSDLVIVCTPVDLIAETVLLYSALAEPGAVFTDVGSTKKRMVDELEGKLPPGIAFVGSHPLAGSEKRGVRHADADLLVGRTTVVTDVERPLIAQAKACRTRVRILKAPLGSPPGAKWYADPS